MDRPDVPTVLVVDDEPAVLRLIEHQLAELPFRIIPTTSPAEAIHILKTREVSVLVSDLNMPEISGNEVLSVAREANPNIVSILASANTDHHATVRAINEGGIWKYVAKPWTKEEIFELVSEGARRYATLCKQQQQLTKLAGDITRRLQAIPAEAEDEDQLTSERYKLIEVIGRGGVGDVYKAMDQLLDIPVAIKVLSPALTNDHDALATLKEEARIAMRLSHRHIVRIHNLQEFHGHYFLVMEYVNGESFHDILNLYGKLPADTVMQIVRVCADALAYAHRHHVVHKDLKPANLLLDNEGVLKIIDFGIACLANLQKLEETVRGTPIYMSPEQLRGEKLDHRTDIYSLGLTVYEMLTGRKAFPEGTTDMRVLVAGPKKLTGLPAELAGVVKRALAPKPEDRWQTVEDFADALLDAAAPLALA